MPTDFSGEWSLFDTVSETLAEHVSDSRDDAIKALALTYADYIETDPSALIRLGSRLLDALEALELSPRSRAVVAQKLGRHSGKGEITNGTAGSLDELANRRARKSATT